MSTTTVLAGRKTDKRYSAKSSGYMELKGAVKDADCRKVRVSGGVSEDLGCCNLFRRESEDTDKFSCGTCRFHTDK